MDAVPMMSEWGATDNLRAIEIDAAVADEHLMGWTHWAYKRWNDPTTADGAQGLFPTTPTLLGEARQGPAAGAHLRPGDGRDAAGDAVRPRRRARSGSATGRTASITAPTRIFVSPLHYPHGYRVAVDGRHRRAPAATCWSAQLDAAVSVRSPARPARSVNAQVQRERLTPRTCVEPE